MKKVNPEYTFDYNFDLNTRTIFLGREKDQSNEIVIDDCSAQDFHKALFILDNSRGPINIFLNTSGGSDTAMWYIIDAIKNCKNKTIITCFGKCFSAGAAILQAADKRLLMPNTRLMIHLGDVSDEPKSEVVKLDQKYEDILYNSIREKHPDFKRNKLKKMLQIDYYMGAQEAVNLGLADDIVMPRRKK